LQIVTIRAWISLQHRPSGSFTERRCAGFIGAHRQAWAECVLPSKRSKGRLGMEICPVRLRSVRAGGGTPAGDLREGLGGDVVDKTQAQVAFRPDSGFPPNKAFMQHSLLALAGIPGLRMVAEGITDFTRFEATGHFVPDA